MSILPHGDLHHLISAYGYWIVGGMVALEGIGVPVPGETTLIAAAILAASSPDLNIALVIVAAAGGAILGDNVGFWAGRAFGSRLLLRFGRQVGLTEGKIKLGCYLFLRQGRKIVFVGRFVAVLRTLAPFLAGTNRMVWSRFIAADAIGAIVSATAYGFGAYFFGKEMHRLAGPIGFATPAATAIVVVAGVIFIRRHVTHLEAEAERTLPGPLRVGGRRRPRSRGMSRRARSFAPMPLSKLAG